MSDWKPIPEFPRYEAHPSGQIRRVMHRPLKGVKTRHGYVRVGLSSHNRSTLRFIHRLVAETFIGPAPMGYQVNHKDGDRTNNAVENLEYVTAQENQRHSWQHLNRQPHAKGTRVHFAKLTDTDVILIRQLRRDGQTYKSIAQHFNTKAANIWHICKGRTWKHLLTDC